MFDDVLIESAGKDKKKGQWKTALVSAVIHLGLVGAIIAAGLYVKKNPEVIEKPIQAFMVQSAPPPPPPPAAPARGAADAAADVPPAHRDPAERAGGRHAYGHDGRRRGRRGGRA